MGDRSHNITKALKQLAATRGVRVIQVSTIRETEPVGGVSKEKFLNGVVEIETTLSPRTLLRRLQEIEAALGRRRTLRWGPRPIDLDVLLYGTSTLVEEHLVIPHPLMHERRFVLEPLAEIAPEIRHPKIRETIAELLRKIS